jgi:hypothetical protein
MAKQFFNNIYTGLMRSPLANSPTVCELPMGSVLLDAEKAVDIYTKVIFRSSVDYLGYVPSVLLEEIITPLPFDVVVLPEQTYSLQDLKQYVKLYGNVQYNLCGEICLAMILGLPLQDILDSWAVAAPSVFQRIFLKRVSAPTGLPDLVSILKMYDTVVDYDTVVNDIEYIQTAFYQKEVSRPVLTPARLKKWTDEDWQIIINVKINNKGIVSDTGTPHWVVILDVLPVDLGGLVLFYNPAVNGFQLKAWEDFITSVGAPIGLIIKTNGVKLHGNKIRDILLEIKGD